MDINGDVDLEMIGMDCGTGRSVWGTGRGNNLA
jgi:hypothetical protein